MTHSANTFVYVTYIRTTPEKLWEALTSPEFNRKYWMGAHQESDWRKGSPWRIMLADGRVADSGEIVEIEPLKRVELKWRNDFMPELDAEGFTRCTYEMEETNGMVKLTVTHQADDAPRLIKAVSNGWPLILSGLKSLLETGQALPSTERS
jgi:uncharacterized protein YndB with AHSA1/START domain